MKSITYENNKFIIHNGEQQDILLDGFNLMSNKSRLPMHTLSNEETIPGLLLSLVQKHAEISNGTCEDSENGRFAAHLLDILLTTYLIRTSAPLKVAEIGAVNGILSYHLASLMGKLNPESFLCCVSNVIGNESGNQWLNRISVVEQAPILSMLIADYEDTHLESDHFDIIVINGAVPIDKPYETIREAERLLKKDGILLCYTKNSPLLESCYKLIFSICQEYEIASNEKLLIARYDGESWGRDNALQEKTPELFGELHQAVISGSHEKLWQLISKIDLFANKAAEIYDIKRKVELIQLKEHVLNYVINNGDEFEELYRERLKLAITNLTL